MSEKVPASFELDVKNGVIKFSGSEEFVTKMLSDNSNNISSFISVQKEIHREGIGNNMIEQQSIKKHNLGTKKLSLKEFLIEKQPKTDAEKAITIGFYFENYQDKASWTASEIMEGFKNAKESLPTNSSQTMIECKKKGWIDNDKEKGFYITKRGENAVNEGFLKSKKAKKTSTKKVDKKKVNKTKISPTVEITKLIENGFFKTRAGVNQVLEELKRKAVYLTYVSVDSSLRKTFVKKGLLEREKNPKTNTWEYFKK